VGFRTRPDLVLSGPNGKALTHLVPQVHRGRSSSFAWTKCEERKVRPPPGIYVVIKALSTFDHTCQPAGHRSARPAGLEPHQSRRLPVIFTGEDHPPNTQWTVRISCGYPSSSICVIPRKKSSRRKCRRLDHQED